jgi:hypothetical protein
LEEIVVKKLMALIGIAMTLVTAVSCKTAKPVGKTSAVLLEKSTTTGLAKTNFILAIINGTVIKMADGKIGLLILPEENAVGKTPGLVITRDAGLTDKEHVWIEVCHLEVVNSLSREEYHCLQVKLQRLTPESETLDTTRFYGNFANPIVFRGKGTVVATGKNLEIVALQENSSGLRHYPGIVICPMPKLEPLDRVNCWVSYASVTNSDNPKELPHAAFMIEIKKLEPVTFKGVTVAQKTLSSRTSK